MRPIEKVENIIIHQTQRNNDFPLFIKLRHKHLRGWEDIGYHFLIGNERPFTKDGKLYLGRPEIFEGAHTLGHNHNSLGVCLIGNFDKKIPSKKQFETLISFTQEKIEQYGIDIENVKGHNEFEGVGKSCPGELIDMNYIRSVISGEEIFSLSTYKDIINNNWVAAYDQI